MIKNSIQEGREPGVAVVRCQRTTVKRKSRSIYKGN